jgi:hypothetical protein
MPHGVEEQQSGIRHLANTPRRVRSALGAAALAAIVMGCSHGGSSALPTSAGSRLPANPGQSLPVTPNGVAFDAAGWHWNPFASWEPTGSGSGLAVYLSVQVPNGLLGECMEANTQTVCTSGDGIEWSANPDPAVFAKDGAANFRVAPIVDGPAGYLMSNAIYAGDSSNPPTWASADGVRWQTFSPVSACTNPYWDFIGETDRYLGQCAGTWYQSTDGRNWAPITWAEPIKYIDNYPGWGLLAESDGEPHQTWYSRDSHTWALVVFPGQLNSFNAPTARLPDGTFLAMASQYDAAVNQIGDSRLIESKDGVNWTAVTTFPAGDQHDFPTVVGNTLFMTVGDVSGSSARQLWMSDDSGATWRHVITAQDDVSVDLTYKGKIMIDVDGQGYVGQPAN